MPAKKKPPREKVIRVRVDAEVYRKAEITAARKGLDISVYTRLALHERLELDGVKV